MKNAIYKNKVLGVCALLFAVSIALPQLAKAETSYSRTPSGNGTYNNVSITFDIDETSFDGFKGDYSEVSESWDSCHIELEGIESGNTQTLDNSGITFGAGQYIGTIDISDYEGEDIFEVGDVAFYCYDSEDEENTLGTIEIEESTGSPIFYIANTQTEEEETGYSGMFGTSGGSELTGNISSFINNSGVMVVVLLFIGLMLGFYIIQKLIGGTQIEESGHVAYAEKETKGEKYSKKREHETWEHYDKRMGEK